MDTIDIQRDPCAEAIARAVVAIPAEDEFEGVDEGTVSVTTSWTPGRERPIKYIQHPAYRRFLRPAMAA